jgi:hypothetical protein
MPLDRGVYYSRAYSSAARESNSIRGARPLTGGCGSLSMRSVTDGFADHVAGVVWALFL